MISTTFKNMKTWSYSCLSFFLYFFCSSYFTPKQQWTLIELTIKLSIIIVVVIIIITEDNLNFPFKWRVSFFPSDFFTSLKGRMREVGLKREEQKKCRRWRQATAWHERGESSKRDRQKEYKAITIRKTFPTTLFPTTRL